MAVIDTTVIEKMKELVDTQFVIDYLRDYTNATASNIEKHLIDEWAIAKLRLFEKYFHNTLTIEKEISFCLPFYKTELGEEWCKKINNLRQDINDSITTDDLTARWLKIELNDYMRDLSTDKKYTYKRVNYVSNISNKTKLVRACHKLFEKLKVASEYINRFEKLMEERSLIIQEAWTRGTLVLSIDPKDFLTASDNDCGWTSCFSLRENGECRGSVYSAAVTDGIMIAYIKADKDCTYYEKSFSNKKWRAWILDNAIIDDQNQCIDEFLYVAKNYPFSSENITNCIYNWLFELNNKQYVPCTVPWRYRDTFMYLDYNNEDTYYVPKNSNEIYTDFKRGPIVDWGVYPVDLENGKEILESNRDVCLEGYCCCECCCRLREEDTYYAYDEIYCEDCFYKYYFFCDRCGEAINKDEINYIEGEGDLCDYCLRRYYDEHPEKLEELENENETSYPKVRPSF